MLLPSLSTMPILVVALLLLLEESLCAGGSQYHLTQIRRPKPPILKSGPECPTPYFPNGVAKARQRNKMIRYTCSSGFYLVGNMYSMCEKGRWDAPVPICIKAGCADLEAVENGQLSYEYGRAAVMLFCSTGYQIAGSSKAYCNGTHWDRPLGSCRETGIAVQTSCDFEVMDYCGWTNEATHDFDWKRSDGVISPKALKTGPKYDHTTMVPLAGHFLMVDSAVQLTNETARLLSPLYPANYSQSACFQFFYHMYGDQIGSLTVYVKPSSVSLDSLTAEDVQFHRDTNQGNIWNEGFFQLKDQSESFQIVIEASLGMKYTSDIAIDDVSLLTGSDCRTGEGQDDALEISSVAPGEDSPPEVPTADKDTFKIDSCENRCGANVSTPIRVGELFFIHCDCIEGCVDTKTCCPDYAERCVWSAGDSPSSTTVSTTPSTTSTTLTTPSTTPSTTSTTVASTTTTAAPTTTTVKATTSTTLRSTSTTQQSTSTTQRSTTTTKRSTNTTTQRSTTRSTTSKAPITTTTGKPYNLRPRTSTGAPNVVVPMVRTRKPTTPTTTTITSTEPTTVELRIISRINLETTASRIGDTKPNLAHVFIYTGVAAIVFSAIVVAIVLHIRRNSGASVLERLKQKSMKKGYGNGTEGFEDVRFLAVDEHLDFSLPDDAEEAEESDQEDEAEKAVQKKGQKPNKKGKNLQLSILSSGSSQLRLSVPLIVVVCFSFAEAGPSRSYSYRQRPVLRNTYICSYPHFPNGQIKIRLRGKILMFECNEGYTLVGGRYMYCREGRWDTNTPICIKPGCDEFPAAPNGFIFYEKQKSAATLFCSSDYQAAGSPYSYCNGTHWDRAIGNCRKTGLAVQTSCDFEVEDWCGWTSEATHEYNWRRSAGIVSMRTLKTGPKHDHTTGNALDGHFLMVDSSEQLSNSTTRLISPIYTANYSTNACFQFFYHMHGDSVGSLSVYVKPLSKWWNDVVAAGAQFSVNGSQGNAWNQGFFDLPEQSESFQILFVASLGMRFRSDMAIDDVSLLSGVDCNGVTGTDVTPTEVDEEEVFKIDSCENRCEQTLEQSYQTMNVIHCGCNSDCISNTSCCPDYIEQCVFTRTDVTSVEPASQWSTGISEDFDGSRNNEYITEKSKNYSKEIRQTSEGSSAVAVILMLGLFVMILGLGIVVVLLRNNGFSEQIYAWRMRSFRFGNRDTRLVEDLQFLATNEQQQLSDFEGENGAKACVSGNLEK